MKKARAWLDEHNVPYRFHDYKVDGVSKEKLQEWCAALGWDVVLNRAGTTFRKLADGDKENLDATKAVFLMLAQPSMIKRPIIECGAEKPMAGFRPDVYAAAVRKA
jgi:arsenate reductase (glutaredoxin)